MTSPQADGARSEIDKHLGGYLKSGQATLSEDHADESTRYVITPSNPRAASIDITLDGSVLSITVGNGTVELYDRTGQWVELGPILGDIANGRYSEEIKSGWLSERKIRMRFETADLKPSYSRLTYDEDEEAPAAGNVIYESW